MGDVQLWVRPEVMELGVLPILPPDKISMEMLSRLLQYAQDLGERGYPKMSYDTWKHIAVKKMGLTVECSMVVFFSCLLFSKLQPGRDRELEASLSSAASQKERDGPITIAQGPPESNYSKRSTQSLYGKLCQNS